MIYARCGNCATVVPLWCSGQFMPHMPVQPAATPHGAYCSVCGVLPPVFTCGRCWCRQYLMLEGAALPAMPAGGPGQSVASAVVAPEGAAPSTLRSMLDAFLKSAAAQAGTGFGQQISGGWS